MEVDFVPYQEALELHNIGVIFPNVGFPHFAIYRNGNLSFANDAAIEMFIKDFKDEVVVAPLYQQSFRRFREKYNLSSETCIEQYRRKDDKKWMFSITYLNEDAMYTHSKLTFETYEEAELACLRKLIEIIKSQKE